MQLFKVFNRIILLLVLIIIIFGQTVYHFVIYFFLEDKQRFGNIINSLESSPLFNFKLENECSRKKVVFHRWGGWIELYSHLDVDLQTRTDIIIHDETDIEKIYGKYFCYAHIYYRSLLRNGQIIKKGTECPREFNKNCGKIDTLEQELCIKDTQNCPLYDVSLNRPDDIDNYENDDTGKIYYNKDNYNVTNKTIIGKLILNDGQPCYKLDEKLWKSFYSEETDKTKTICDNSKKIYDVYEDERYKNLGEITYKQLYEDNLPQTSKELVLVNVKGDEEVILYKREFIGLDKECELEIDITQDKLDAMKNALKMERTLSLTEGIILLSGWDLYFIAAFIVYCIENGETGMNEFIFIPFVIYYLLIFACMICHLDFYLKIVKVDKPFNCSDKQTNELIAKEREYNKDIVLKTEIALILDAVGFGVCCIITLVGLITDKVCYQEKNNEDNNNDNNNNNNDEKNTKDEIQQESKEIPLNAYYNKQTDP